MAEQAGAPVLAASSLRAALDADWDDPAARDQALAQIVGLLDQVEAFIAGQAGDEAAAAAVTVARQVRDQDMDCSGPALGRGVARDRRSAWRIRTGGTAASPGWCCSTGTSGT